jgi:predicted amidophosphoribosyltransferase
MDSDEPVYECEVCGALAESFKTLCDTCRRTLKAIVDNVRPIPHVAYSALELRNIRLSTDIHGASAVVSIDGSSNIGVQRPFRIEGDHKCLCCDSYMSHSEDQPLCSACTKAISWATTVSEGEGVQDLIWLSVYRDQLDTIVQLSKEGKLMKLLEALSDDAIRSWVEKEIATLTEEN